MLDFWNDIINSTSIINSATILSLLLAVIFFIYQEFRSSRERAKETQRLKEEIISLIIRNEVNDNISLDSVAQLEVILEGFDLLKDTRLGYKPKDILKIAYTRVYENEYTSEAVRKKVLGRLEAYIEEYDNSNESISEDIYSHKHMTMTTYIIVIVVLILYSFCMIIGLYIQTNIGTPFFKMVIMSLSCILPIMAIKYLYSVSSQLTLKLIRISNAIKDMETIKHVRQVKDVNRELMKKVTNEYETKDEIKFEDLFTSDKNIVKNILEYRLIIEKLTRELYCRKFNEADSRIPLSRLIRVLAKDGVLSADMADRFIKIYFLSNQVAHEGFVSNSEISEDWLFGSMVTMANYLKEELQKL